jgi:hypothetical protein
VPVEDKVDGGPEKLLRPIGGCNFGDHLIDREDCASLGAPPCRAEWDAFHGVYAVFDSGSDALIGFGQDSRTSLMDHLAVFGKEVERDYRIVALKKYGFSLFAEHSPL